MKCTLGSGKNSMTKMYVVVVFVEDDKYDDKIILTV